MSTIQDIHALEEKIYSVVEEYLSEQDCYNNPVFAIWRRCGKISISINDLEKLKLTKTAETYPISDLIRTSETNEQEPDCDKINDIANNWLFVE